MKLAVLGHLLSENDYKKLPLGKYIPLWFLERLVNLIPDDRRFAISSHFDIFGKADGYVISIALTPEQMVSLPKERVRKICLDAILYAQDKLGCDLVMLGALTAPVTAAGLWLRQQPELKIKITTGNTFTAAISVRETETCIKLAGLKKEKIKIAIVGAAGVIGSGIARYFNEEDYNLILVERDMGKYERLSPLLKGDKYVLSDKISDIINADVIVTATSHPEAFIVPQYLKKGAIIIDVAEPQDVVSNIEELRPDVICVDGGRVKWKKINIKVNLGLPKHVCFACITEGVMQVLEEDNNDYIGAIEMDHLKKTIEWGKKWDFEQADFTCFNRPINLERFKNIKKLK